MGTAGEIELEGSSVALGYVGEPQLTSKKFAQADESLESRIYKTGDVAVFVSDDTLVYLGRRDRQIKLLGNRIELDEVETAASNCPNVTQAATVVVHDQHGEANALAVAFTPSSVEVETVQAHLRKVLPCQMMPDVLAGLDNLPLTKNGKIDTKALVEMLTPKIQDASPGEETELLMRLRAIVEEILGATNIGADENLFLHGLDSIKSLRVAAQLRSYGVTSPDVLQLASLRGIARKCEERAVSKTAGETLSERLPQRLTPAANWFLGWNAPHPDRYAQFAVVRLKEPKSTETVVEAVAELAMRHDALRQVIDIHSGHIGTEFRQDADIPVVALDESETLENAAAIVTDKIDFASGKLISVGSYGEISTCFLLAFHHLAVDAYSWLLLLQELDGTLCGTFGSSSPDPHTEVSNRGAYLERAAQNITEKHAENWHQLVKTSGPVFLGQANHPPQRAFTQTTREFALDGVALETAARGLARLNAETLTLSVLLQALLPWTTEASCQIELERTGRTEINGVPSNLSDIGWFSALFPVAPPSFTGSWDRCFKNVIAHMAQLPTEPELFGALQQIQTDKFDYKPGVRLNPLGSSLGVDLNSLTVKASECGLFNGTGVHSQCAAELDVAWTSTEILVQLRADPCEISPEEQGLLLDRLETAFQQAKSYLSQQGERNVSTLNFEAIDLSEDELALLWDAASENSEVERNEA